MTASGLVSSGRDGAPPPSALIPMPTCQRAHSTPKLFLLRRVSQDLQQSFQRFPALHFIVVRAA